MITNIQKYSIHDGKGIRTTIFFKGCPLRCRWCHNPETWSYERDLFYYPERCMKCGACVGACKNKAITLSDIETERTKCDCSGDCEDVCCYNAREICGKDYRVEDLVKEACKDQAFYETSGGGVTLSGGEVLSQDMDYVETLVRRLSEKGISVNIDTCGLVPYSHIQRVLPYVDTFLYDIKLMDEEKHLYYTGVSNEDILENLVSLSKETSKIWIRIPVIGGVNDNAENMNAVITFLQKHQIRPEHIHLLPYHDIGMGKYERLGKEYKEIFTVPSPEKMEEFRQMFAESGCGEAFIGG